MKAMKGGKVIGLGGRANLRALGRTAATPSAVKLTRAFVGKRINCATTTSVSARAASRMALSVVALADPNAITVSDTKQKFLAGYAQPIPALYSTIIQELLVQHHLIRFAPKHQYDKIYALGFNSVYDGIMDSFPGDKEVILESYLAALDEDYEQLRNDAKSVSEWASGLSSVDEMVADASGSAAQQEFVEYASEFSERTRVYNKFVGIGLFRMLELASAADPASLEKLASSLSLPLTRVTSDLTTYKGMLSKMTKAKELMEEIIAEQKKKQKEREAEKAAKAASPSNGELPSGGAPAAT